MEQGNLWINEHIVIIIGLLLILIIVLTVMLINNNQKLMQLQKKYDFFLRGENKNIDELLENTLQELDKSKASLEELQTKHSKLREQVRGCLQTVKMERYDAFDAMGGELSYSLLVEDEDHNGIILTSIYGRDESRSYAKLIEKGKSKTPLAEEEKKLL